MDEKLIKVLARGLVVWFVIIFVESLHGVARGLLLEPVLGDFRARQVSVFIGAAIIVAITFVFVRWLKGSRINDFFLVGLLWVLLTIGFEILLGRLVMNLSWERIASDYNLAAGGLMPLGLLVMLIAPVTLAKMYDEI
jgi:hypothetical protein